MERRLREQFGTTDSNPHAITLDKGDEKTTVTKLPQPSANQAKILTALAVTLPATM
jgi:hypothetical protein